MKRPRFGINESRPVPRSPVRPLSSGTVVPNDWLMLLRLPPVPVSAVLVRASAMSVATRARLRVASWSARSFMRASVLRMSAPSWSRRSDRESSSVTTDSDWMTCCSSLSFWARVSATAARSLRSLEPALMPWFWTSPSPASPPPSWSIRTWSLSRVGWSKVLKTSCSSTDWLTAERPSVAPEGSASPDLPGSIARYFSPSRLLGRRSTVASRRTGAR